MSLIDTQGLGGLAGSEIAQLGSGLAGGLFARFTQQSTLAGVSFSIIDSREQAGRRINRILFPNQDPDKQLFQDFGAIDTPLSISGVIIGDDYVTRSKRMRKALMKSGKVTLVHPWWGNLKVRLTKPATFQFRENAIRCTTFQVELVRDPDPPAKKGLFARINDTINNVLEKADELMDEAQSIISDVLSIASLPLAIINGISSLISQYEGIFNSITASAPEPVKSAIAPFLSTASQGISSSRPDYADQVVTALTAMPAAIASSITEPDQSVIANPTSTQAGETVTGQEATKLLLSAAQKLQSSSSDIASTSSDPGTILALVVAAQSFIISQLASSWTASDFASNQEAEQARDQIVSSIDDLAKAIEEAAKLRSALALGGLYKAAQALKAGLIADANSRIGSLPQVLEVPVAERTSLWALCYAMEGDDTNNVQKIFDDAITRNHIRHPALTPPGLIEMLEMSHDD